MSDPSSRAATAADAITTRRQIVNDALPEYLAIEDPEELYEASRYLLDAGGKRLRPTISLLVAESLVGDSLTDYQSVPALVDGPQSQSTDTVRAAATGAVSDNSGVDVMAAAVSIEVIQSFTLIHDDIMDDDDMRRGVPAVHSAYDLETAILAGDTLYSKAFEFMLQTNAPPERRTRAMDVLAKTCTEICEGQSRDVTFEERGDVTPEEYLSMVRAKTAVLYGAAAAIPAILLGAEDRTVDSLYTFGVEVGQAFQIKDDLLDLTASSDQLGKQRGSDLIENKQTIITVHAREHGLDTEELLSGSADSVTEAEIEAAVAELEAVGSIQYAEDTATELVTSGNEHLSVLPAGQARETLRAIAWYLVERDY